MSNEERSSAMPDSYDRQLGALDGLPGVLSTKPAIIQRVTPILGTAETYVVRTVRRQDRTTDANGGESATPAEFTVFLEHTSRETGLIRIVIPPKVAELIARQREALTGQARKKLAKRLAQDRKARGVVPGFLKTKRAKR